MDYVRKVIILIICIINSSCFFTTTNKNLEDYTKKRNNWLASQAVLPDLDDLPNYINIYYQRKYKAELMFFSDSILLVVEYDEETYNNEILNINEFKYLDSPVFFRYDDKTNESFYLIPQHEFYIGSYYFRVLEANANNEFDYPKKMGIIATSDKENSIAYLYYWDTDRDYIGSDMITFINKYFKYKW